MFWKPPNPFGQWTHSPFRIQGITYNCAEQYMMAEKARLFGDQTIETQILATENPREQKKLGQRVSGFDENRWAQERRRIVFSGNYAKFTQNADLKVALLATGDRMMVEASPLDVIWGIGFAANDPNAFIPEKWRGMNLLGQVLGEVREHIRAG